MRINHKTGTFSIIFHSHKKDQLALGLGLVLQTEMTNFRDLPFNIIQLVKSLPFYSFIYLKPEKAVYPFQAKPPRI